MAMLPNSVPWFEPNPPDPNAGPDELMSAEQMAYLLGLEGGRPNLEDDPTDGACRRLLIIGMPSDRDVTPETFAYLRAMGSVDADRSKVGYRCKIALIGKPATEEQRYDVINNTVIARLHEAPEVERQAVIARFCAMYLPKLVDKFLKPPPPDPSNPQALEWSRILEITGPYFHVIRTIESSPYFAKFITSEVSSDDKATMMAARLGEQLLKEAILVNSDLSSGDKERLDNNWTRFGKVVTLLTWVLSLRAERQRNIPLPADIRIRLSGILDHWHSSAPSYGFACCASLLRGEQTYEEERKQIRDFLQGLTCCARQGCKAAFDLYQCKR